MEKKKELPRNRWAVILAAAKILTITANSNRYAQGEFRPDLLSFDPADLLDMKKAPWPDEL